MKFSKSVSAVLIVTLLSGCQTLNNNGISNADVGTVAGGVGGLLVGSAFGGGVGKVAAMAAGAGVGALAGRAVGKNYDNNNNNQ